MVKLTVGATVGKHSQSFSRDFDALVAELEAVRREGLRKFAVEVRRRARISLTKQRTKYYPSGADTRYSTTLWDAIDFTIDADAKNLHFDVGKGLPYAGVEDREGYTVINAKKKVMSFFWYKVGHRARFRTITKKGKGYFSRAFQTGMDDFGRIMGEVFDEKMARKR